MLLVDFSNTTKMPEIKKEEKEGAGIDYEESYYLYGFCVPHNGNLDDIIENYNKCNFSLYRINTVNAEFNFAFSNREYQKINSFYVNRKTKTIKIDFNFIVSIVIISMLMF